MSADARRQSFVRQTFTFANREPLSCLISSNHVRDRADDGAPKQVWLAEQLRHLRPDDQRPLREHGTSIVTRSL